jgi:hypothetical protein
LNSGALLLTGGKIKHAPVFHQEPPASDEEAADEPAMKGRGKKKGSFILYSMT